LRGAESAPAAAPASMGERAETFRRAFTEQHCGRGPNVHIILADALRVENITHIPRGTTVMAHPF